MPWPSLLAPPLRLWGTLEGPGSPGPNSRPDGKTLSTMSSRFFEPRFVLDSTCFVLRWNTPRAINRTRRKGDHAADGTRGWSGSSVLFRGGARLRLRTPPLPFACIPRPTAAERFIHGAPFLSSRRPRKGPWEWGCRANKRRILSPHLRILRTTCGLLPLKATPPSSLQKGRDPCRWSLHSVIYILLRLTLLEMKF